MIDTIIIGGLIGCAIANFVIVHKVRMYWRAALRRENVLLDGMRAIGEALRENNQGEVYEAFGVTGIRYADENHNQRRAGTLTKFWPRVPEVGESWPDFEPVQIDFVDET